MKLAELFGFSPKGNGDGARAASRAAGKAISLCHALLSERGEVSGSRLAGEALSAYAALDPESRKEFFRLLLREFSPDPERVGRASDAYRRDPSALNLARLQKAVEPPRRNLFRRLNVAPGATLALVEMRGHVLEALEQSPGWEPIASDLGHLLTAWFNRGFLSLRRIDWRTSATILEKLIHYEAVHEVQGWDDLRRRLQEDRRCYAFFHPAMPDEPVIFIQVALTRGMSDRVQPLLDTDSPVLDPESADCAVFYSITNCQEGLRGVPFGSFLIKQVAERLGSEFPRLRKFATLSPLPGFREWLEGARGQEAPSRFPALAGVLAVLERPAWHQDRELAGELQRKLVPLGAWYLLNAKHGKEPLDAVARFHLRNGARLERINWLGDTSAAGLERSAGLMVNYVYRLSEVERNHELYSSRYKIASSYEIEALAKQALNGPREARPTQPVG